jgi:hypothetical protein
MFISSSRGGGFWGRASSAGSGEGRAGGLSLVPAAIQQESKVLTLVSRVATGNPLNQLKHALKSTLNAFEVGHISMENT